VLLGNNINSYLFFFLSLLLSHLLWRRADNVATTYCSLIYMNNSQQQISLQYSTYLAFSKQKNKKKPWSMFFNLRTKMEKNEIRAIQTLTKKMSMQSSNRTKATSGSQSEM
jgi:hypothetical protein